MKRQPLIKDIPQLYQQWDFEVNEGLDVNKIRYGSNRKVAWICDKGHKWNAVVSTRKKHGCPYCSGRFPIPGETDFATKNPHLLEEWDNEKNGELKPEHITSCSEKKIWWRCSKGHSYLQRAHSRTYGGGCPYCAGKAVLPGYNDLFTMNPDFLNEWDEEKNLPYTPADFVLHSNKKVWWRCEKRHSWKAEINKRSAGTGCPCCAGKKILVGFNDLASMEPQIAGQWDYEKNHGLTPKDVTVGNNRKVWWKCERGHGWEAVIYSRKNENCPYCSRRRLLSGFNDLMTESPEIAKEWDYEKNAGMIPSQVTACSREKAWFRCEKGHSWRTGISNRAYGTNCPYCSGRYPVEGETDLKSKNPEILPLWDYEKNGEIKPEHVTSSSAKRMWWRCEKGHSWRTPVYHLTAGHRCPYCAGRKVMIGFNDLKTVSPDIAMEWDYEKNGTLTPEMVTQSSGKKVWWKCRKGHSWKIGIDHRNTGSNCPYCSGHMVIPGETDLTTVAPKLAEQWDQKKNGNLKPEDVSLYSNKKVWWCCEEGHSWKTVVCDRAHGTDCPYCKGKKPVTGETDFATKYPELAEEWDHEKNGDLRPEDILPYSYKRVWWKCRNGHGWIAGVYTRSYGSGCPYCAGRIPVRTRFIT